MTSIATDHYRNMFERRSPEELRTLAHIKRFMERLVADQNFRSALAEEIETPRPVALRYGIDVDPLDMLPLWRGTHLHYRSTPECERWPLAVMWDTYIKEMLLHRDLLRDEGDMSASNPRFHAWRERQMRRCSSELQGSAASVTHPVIAFELSEGCTVGCWFCGLSADRFKGYYDYSDTHAQLWRGIVDTAHQLLGPAVRTGFCYWATDPCDNPDYDRFILDYYKITGALPQTTTAAPLKDEALTRSVLDLFSRYRTVTNRFSVLSVKHLDQIHAAFTPEELLGVELVTQNKESLTAKADAGRTRDRRAILRAADKDDKVALVERNHTTIACVSGFLVNMPLGRIQLVTPVPGSERWPLGYRIVGAASFSTVSEFQLAINGLIEKHMQPGLSPDQPLRFRRDLSYEPDVRSFHLRSANGSFNIRDDVSSASVGEMIACGSNSASQVITLAGTTGFEMLAIADLLDQLHDAGVLEEDLDDRYAGQASVLDETSRESDRSGDRDAVPA